MEEERGRETENVYTWETKYERTWYTHSYITVGIFLVNKKDVFAQAVPPSIRIHPYFIRNQAK